MKIGAIGWTGNNIGDDIQTVAVTRYLPPVDLFLNRDELNTYDGPEILLVMNGWFLMKTQNWPPSERIRPIFFGFHVQKGAKPIIAQHRDYLKRHEPIGCRDIGTTEFIRSLGVEAYFSHCATMTFDAPADRAPDSIYFVEADRRKFIGSDRSVEGLTVRDVSHRFIDVPTHIRLAYAEEIIRTYGRRARFVITSRIHCAMPCAAMGIPTLFVGPRNYRTDIIDAIGLRRPEPPPLLEKLIGRKPLRMPREIDISDLKQRIKDDLRKRIAEAVGTTVDSARRTGP